MWKPGDGCMAQRLLRTPPLVMTLEPAKLLKPERHEESQECCVSNVSLSQLSSDRAVEPARSLPQLPVKKSHCGFLMDGLVDAQCATKAREWGWGDPLESENERDPLQHNRKWLPWTTHSQSWSCSSYSGGGLRLCSFRSSRLFQYLKLLSKCCIRLGRSAKAGDTIKDSEAVITLMGSLHIHILNKFK